MTDKDKTLLEMAAKAAGFPAGWVLQGWNPLTDDGDALRLAVKLRITVEQELLEVKACAYVLIGTERKYFTSVSGNVSREEATRIAIVRAAAEIGKAQQ